MNMEQTRHSLAHLLAAAVKELYPDAKPTIGPAIDNGFYYDFEFSSPVSEKDLEKIEQKMKEILPSWTSFEGREVTPDEAREYFKENPYKLELINELEEKGEKITFYTSGGFIDLCRGGHSDNLSQEISPDAFKLDRVAGAYWRGDEKNKMLTRIYGLAFSSKEELEAFISQREEAKERDHRKLGKELDLFMFSDLVGPGLPLWTPKGTLLRDSLESYVWELRKSRGYTRVDIPHITKKDLFVTSGHWEKFAEELFRMTTREGHEFALKPMNCPFHTQIFARKKHSYREMPQRYANTTKCYRDEQTGELHGLSRVRAFTQDDAHVFCRETQVKEEAFKIWDIVETFYGTFGFKMKIRLSTHDPEHMEKYQGSIDVWEQAVANMKDWLAERNAEYFVGIGEAAFYGPKIDFIAVDSLGRDWQVATIQVDRTMPKNFGLICVNEKGEEESVVMLHAAIMGSIERFLSVLLEHTGGTLPLFISPVQVKILPISDTHVSYAQEVFVELQKNDIRVEIDDRKEGLGKKIRSAKEEKVPYLLVIGDKEMEEKTITIEGRTEKIGTKSITETIDYLKEIVANKK